MNITILTILLQAEVEQSSPYEIIFIAFLSIIIIIIFAATGKVNMGFQIPRISRPLSRQRKEILKSRFPYYNQLPFEQQRKFEYKLQYFIYIKDFIPRQIPVVTEEMKVLIGACAVQLTFGYPKVFLSHFKRILVYPNEYYSTINRTYHKGEVNPRMRAIVLSWKGFVEGYINQRDGRNLGLHEMAHALRFEDRILNDEYEFLNREDLDQWHKLAAQEIQRIEKGESRMFRDYAGTNHEEFFSIAVENFFECPKEFNSHMPHLYANLALLLKQNPLMN